MADANRGIAVHDVEEEGYVDSRDPSLTLIPASSSREGGYVSIAGEDIPDEQAEMQNLQENVYDVALLSSINVAQNSNHPVYLTKLGLSMFALLVNYVFQVLLLKWTYFYVVVPSIHDMQVEYQSYHRDCFDEHGVFSQEKWLKWPDEYKESLCNMVFSTTGGSNPFLYIVLCLWFMAVFYEIRQNVDMVVQGVGSLRVDSSKDIILHGEGDDSRIVGLTCSTKIFIYAFILIPKMVISVCLLLIGAMWLAATDDFADLILNACALEFVISIDEVLFNAFTPFVVKREIGFTRVKMARVAKRLIEETSRKFIWKAYAYYLLIFLMVYLYQFKGQTLPYVGIMPGYANDAACPDYWIERTHRPCMIHNLRGTPCFPFGPDAEAEPVPGSHHQPVGSHHPQHHHH